jgi:hypothetical protein
MKNWRKLNKVFFATALGAFASCHDASAFSLDWSGYFRADHNFVSDYQLDRSSPGYSNAGYNGEYIPGEGTKSTTFSSVFMKLKPRVLVNDNIIVHSEWNVGDPVYGFFGRNVPTEDQHNPFSTGKGAMSLSVARLWLDVHSDFGTVQVGRAPMQWGLGAIFNSGDNPFDRYQSTSDTIRLVSKFGYLSLMPLYAKNSMGRNLAGARNPFSDQVLQGSDDVTDYGIGLRYDNPEEDLEAGGLYYKRNASDTQTSYYYPSTATSYTSGANGMNLKLFDFFAKKSWHHFELGGELPIYSGEIGDVNGVGSRNTYKAMALAMEAALKYDTWRHTLKLGTVPGQSPATSGAANRGKAFSAMQFNRDYKLGLILFRYNMGNFGPANPDSIPVQNPSAGQSATFNPTTRSPYDASITNAKYVMLATEKHWEQWGISTGLVWAQANQTAKAGLDAYNHRTGQWFTSVADQSKNMGLEWDLGSRYNWDDNISVGADLGFLFPGSYFKYINSTSATGRANTVTALQLSVATVF